MTDIVMRLLEEWTYETEDVMGKAAVEIDRLRGALERAEAVITAIADHADCRGRSVWGCMDLIRDTLSEYDKERDSG